MLGIIRSLRRRLRKSKGYTLVELAAVTAIAAGITAVVLPIAKQEIDNAKKANVVEEAKQLATAVMRFWNDTGSLPNDADTDGDSDVETDAVQALYTGTSSDAPTDATSDSSWTSITTASIAGFLIVNDPDLDGTTDDAYLNWNGPYVGTAKEDIALDPWGHSYLINVEETTAGGETAAIFVISAGPNGKIETSRLVAADEFTGASGDDIVVRIR